MKGQQKPEKSVVPSSVSSTKSLEPAKKSSNVDKIPVVSTTCSREVVSTKVTTSVPVTPNVDKIQYHHTASQSRQHQRLPQEYTSSAYSQAYPDFSRQPYPGNVMKNPQIHSYKRPHNPHSTPNAVGPSFPLQQENMQHPGNCNFFLIN